MSKSIYITSAEGHTGKSTIALGMLDALAGTVAKVGVFRPVARSSEEPDYVLRMLLEHQGLAGDYDRCVGTTYEAVHADPDDALAVIVARYKAMEADYDAVLIVGSDYTDVGTPTELRFNARVAANLGAPVLLTLGGRVTAATRDHLGSPPSRTPGEIRQVADLTLAELHDEHAEVIAVIVNRADPDRLAEIIAETGAVTKARLGRAVVWALPEDPVLVAPTMRSIRQAIDGTLVHGDAELLGREALAVVIAAMSLENVLPRLIEGAVVIVPADRTEVLLAVLMANASGTFPSVAGIVLNGGFNLPDVIVRLMDGVHSTLPIISTRLTSYDAAVRITDTRGRLAADSQRKHDSALALFRQHVDADRLLDLLNVTRQAVVTPLMFEYDLIARARAHRRHIVLPEGDDDRILRAAARLLAQGVAELTILGEIFEVRSRAIELGLDISAAHVLSPFDHVLSLKFADEYARLRASKGTTRDLAADTITDPSYFGTMMVHMGLADGMVSGARHTTAHTIRPAFEIVKTRPGVSVASSVFLMALADRVLVYGDCAVIPDPSAEQLADIALSAAETAAQFGIDPRVAMLSYSTGESGHGADVDKVRQATALVRQRRPELPVAGPIQYDAAADAAVGAAKMPGSDVAGRATVFIFPDLNTGNNTYKAVQRSAGAVAIGPVLQGLRKPINDLSRGASVEDIVNTVAITAIQAAAQPAVKGMHR
ncbi:MAG TPA: phosphate acetyltransferase [Microbacteriaceae bacterium]|nr:phosphate acetyltransferase [Microbacteriaceae bacterium]